MANILIVDDEKMICEEFQDILREEDHLVDVAFSGEEALSKVQEKSYDLVFLDVLMPKMDGGEVFQRLKQLGNIAVVIMSGYLPSHKEKEILAQGAVGCLKKPLDLGKVRKIIQSVEENKSKNG